MLRFDRCYDSHVHWVGTGEAHHRLDLRELKSREGLRERVAHKVFFRGDWLVGFGWDHSEWPPGEKLERQFLDELFPDVPVVLSRIDGHALWVNSEALRRAGPWGGSEIDTINSRGGHVEVDSAGIPTGLLLDYGKTWVEKFVPKPTKAQIRTFLMQGAQIFNQAGITHIRDLTCSEVQWDVSCALAEAGLLTLAVEQYFDVEDLDLFDVTLALANQAKAGAPPLLRVRGIKVYLDGALGSEGAYLGKPYQSGSGRGLQLIPESTLQEVMRRTWESGLEMAIHTIGDAAAEIAVTAAQEIWGKGIDGVMHLEHVELLEPSTTEKMRGRPIVCHLQPSHWLSDRRWLKEKIGDRVSWAFPWRQLQENGISFDFGSDSPIEPPSLWRTRQAIEESRAAGIAPLLGDWRRYHTHPDASWAENSFSEFDANGDLQSVVFCGRHLF